MFWKLIFFGIIYLKKVLCFKEIDHTMYNMYSQKRETQIRNYERTSFQKLKEEENKNREFSISDDILYTSDFTLEKFSNSGDSGDLLLATNKHDHNEKYIVKHEYYECACNEYMYSKIGNKMGIKIAPVKLFVVNDKEKRFKSDFVCGIRYFENCEKVYFDDIIKEKDCISNWKDYFKFRGMEKLFFEADDIEVIRYRNNIYGIDTVDAFSLNFDNVKYLAYNYDSYGINVRDFAIKEILRIAERNTEKRIWTWNFEKSFFIENIGIEYLDYFLEPFYLLKSVSEKDIEEWVNILTFFYPNIIGEYFKVYLSNLKLDVEQFLVEVDNRQLVVV